MSETIQGKKKKVFNLTLDEEQRDSITFQDCHECMIKVCHEYRVKHLRSECGLFIASIALSTQAIASISLHKNYYVYITLHPNHCVHITLHLII